MDQALKDALSQFLGSKAIQMLIQFAVGIGLMYLIDKFFKFVEGKLTDDTKFEIAVWLLDVKVGLRLVPWHETFTTLFYRVFGQNHMSRLCIWRTAQVAAFTFCAPALVVIVIVQEHISGYSVMLSLLALFCLVFVPTYVCLLETRLILWLLSRLGGFNQLYTLLVDLAMKGFVFVVTMVLTAPVLALLINPIPNRLLQPLLHFIQVKNAWMLMVPVYLTSVWLWLYVGSGIIIKAARRFDIGFDWFNRKFDIEKKPLQCIGLITGALVAVAYWTAVIVSRVVG